MATVKEISQLLEAIESLADPVLDELALDQRTGVQKAVDKRRKQLQADLDEDLRLERMLAYEQAAYAKGFKVIAGIDEVGRGPLAGPVVAAAVILPQNCKIKGLNDSKKIPKKKHQEIYETVCQKALAIGIGIVSPRVIDEVNIYQASKLAMMEAVAKLDLTPDYLLIDAMTLDFPQEQEAIIKGDAKSLSIAAASIVAKVVRDQLMADYDQTYPGYDFAQNAGYGTKAHLDGLEKYGVTAIHRRTFEPIKSMLTKQVNDEN